MLSDGFVERRWRNLAVAILAAVLLAAVGIVLSSARANALPCGPSNPDCPDGGGSSHRITHALTVTTPTNGKVTSSDNGINCGLGNTDCTQSYTYIIFCDEFGECTTPDYAEVTLTPTPASGFALSSWGGDCSGSGSCSVTMDDDRTVSGNFADVENPTVALTSPATTNAIVRGTMNLSATASDNAGVSRVDFSYGGSFVGNDTSPPYGLAVDSTTRPDGRHTVGARATDTSGRVSVLVTRSVIVDNHTPTVLDTTDGLEPDRGKRGVTRTTDVSATFSEEMDANTLSPTTFKLQQYNKKTRKWKTIAATLSMSPDNKTATLDPKGASETAETGEIPLAANKKFRGFITTGAKDLAGTPLASRFIWTFTTGG